MANEYLTRTPTSTGNRQTFTISFWTKNNQAGGNFFQQREDSNSTDQVTIQHRTTEDYLRVLVNDGGSVESLHDTTALLRDFSGWQNIIVAFNTSTGLAEDRVKIYVNGVKRADFNADSQPDNPAQNFLTSVNHTVRALIGASRPNSSATLNQFQTAQLSDFFLVDGQELTPDVFGFYKDGNGYVSVGTSESTDFRPGQWVPKKPSVIKNSINNDGGFGVNGFYLPMNDSSNFGADFHCDPNTIITLQDETAAQPKNGAPTTTDSYVSQLRSDPYAANLVLAVPGITGGQGSGYGDYHADIKGSGSNKTVTANGDAGVAVTASYYGSAMQFDGTGDYFSVPNSSDLRFTSEDFTIETWFNTNSLTDDQFIFSQWNVTDDRRSYVLWLDSGVLKFNGSSTGANADNGSVTNTISVGANQWNHAAFTREGATNRLFLNGVCVGINTATQDFYNNTDDTPRIGGEGGTGTRVFDGYLQDLRVYKGVAKYKSGFDVSKPYTPVGIATWRAVPDCTANNFPTLNSIGSGILDRSGGTAPTATYSNGNLTVVATQDSTSARSTIGVSTGKWYWEVRYDVNSSAPGNGIVGLTSAGTSYDDAAGASYEPRSDRFRKAGSTFYDGTNNQTDNGLIVGVALDKNVGIISFFADGTLQSSGTMTGLNTLSEYHLPECFTYNDGASNTFTFNFGQNPTFCGQVSVSSTQRNADANGKGQFRYAPPSDFLALCEDNLPTPAITDPGKYFKTVLWTGDGNMGRNITGVGFKPDLVWIKSRSFTNNHHLFDSVRGPNRILRSSTRDRESIPGNIMPSFNDDGFTVGEDGSNNATNDNGNNFVAWCWQAGAGTTSLNTDGAINSVVSVNQDAGFSIVSYTGTGSNTTVGHGLTVTPNVVICKNRTDDNTNWSFNGNVAGLTYGTNKMMLQSTSAIVGDTNEVMGAGTSIINLGNSSATNDANNEQIAYCWHSVDGFSKFGSYVGNGSQDGPFVYCGFKPAFLMIKRTDTTGEWWMYDNSRGSINPIPRMLLANADGTENEDSASYLLDFVSNGFKWRSGLAASNGNGGSFFFMAFAESPFKTANAK